MPAEPVVFIVDDERDVRDAVSMLIRSIGLPVQAFASAQEFLGDYRPDQPGCLVLDVRMPGISGIDLQEAMAAKGIRLPIVFISGHGDIPMAVRAVRAGAVDFLEKPFSDQTLLDRVQKSIELDRRWRREARDRDVVRSRMAQLTPRELEVMECLVAGKVNKIIARELDLSTRTVEIHRARVLQKMEADNVSQLVRLVLSIREDTVRQS